MLPFEPTISHAMSRVQLGVLIRDDLQELVGQAAARRYAARWVAFGIVPVFLEMSSSHGASYGLWLKRANALQWAFSELRARRKPSPNLRSRKRAQVYSLSIFSNLSTAHMNVQAALIARGAVWAIACSTSSSDRSLSVEATNPSKRDVNNNGPKTWT